MRTFAKIIAFIFFSIFYRVELVNAANVPGKGPFILCANHKGWLDMFFIGYRIPRWVHYMAKEELFRNPPLGWLLKTLGAFPVKRGKGDIESIKTAFKLLEEGHILGILPEGTRMKSRKRGEIKPKPGAAMIAIKAGVPIIPVAIGGSYRPFSKIRVVYGKPFNLDLDKSKKYTVDEMREISQNIMDRVYDLLEEK